MGASVDRNSATRSGVAGGNGVDVGIGADVVVGDAVEQAIRNGRRRARAANAGVEGLVEDFIWCS
jgi:hypothetical protein